MKKNTWIKLHLYCGLFTSFYLLAFGFSSIVMNHQIELDRTEPGRIWDTRVQVDTSGTDRQLAENLRDQLGLMGWTPPWQYQKDTTRFQFAVVHLAKETDVKVDLHTGAARVTERPKGLLAVLHGLHFFNGRIPNAPFFLRTWVVYQWLTLLVLLTSLLLGLWLWIRYSYKSWELYAFGGLFLISFLLMLLL